MERSARNSFNYMYSTFMYCVFQTLYTVYVHVHACTAAPVCLLEMGCAVLAKQFMLITFLNLVTSSLIGLGGHCPPAKVFVDFKFQRGGMNE